MLLRARLCGSVTFSHMNAITLAVKKTVANVHLNWRIALEALTPFASLATSLIAVCRIPHKNKVEQRIPSLCRASSAAILILGFTECDVKCLD